MSQLESFDKDVYLEYLDTLGRYKSMTAAIKQAEAHFSIEFADEMRDRRRDLSLELLAMEKLIPLSVRLDP